MAAVISGEGLGLYGSSLKTLGEHGPANNPVVGRNGNQVYVNAYTGNLVITHRDEFIASLGLDLALSRTYNSLGILDGDNNTDNWRLSVHRKLTINAGVSITKIYGDGSEIVFNYNSSLGYYLSTAGDGAHDTIRAEGSNWVWNDGSDDITETYNSSGQLVSSKDTDNNVKTFGYNGAGLVTQISDSSGQTVTLTYSGLNLQSVTTSSSGVTQTRVSYGYDASNRLTSVTVDLTPANTADTETFITRYTYDGATKRIATIDYTGGGVPDLAIGYDASGRVQTLTDSSGSITQYSYGASSTTVTDPLLRQTIYHRDAQGRLTRVETPPLTSGGTRLVTEYVYDSSSNVTQVKDGTGAITAFQYDSRGNLTRQTDAVGNVVEYGYTTDNLLATETVYLVADPDYSGMNTITNGTGQAADPQTTYYIYDAKRHLRFSISPAGKVTEHRYFANGMLSTTLSYAKNTYSIAPLQTVPTEAAMASWATAADLTAVERIDYQYDFRGQLSRTTRYSATDSAGTGLASGAAATHFIYDQRGLLLKSVSPRGTAPVETAATAPGAIQQNLNNHETVYVYDGLGRLISQRDAAGTLTTVNYDDINNRVTTTFASSLVTTDVYTNTGRLISSSQYDAAQSSVRRNHYNLYDAAGQLRVAIEPTGAATYYFYDGAGRQIAAIDPEGLLTEFVYDGAGRLQQKLSYANRVSQTLLNQLAVSPTVLESISAMGQGLTKTATGQFSASNSTVSNTQTATFTSGAGSENTNLAVSSVYSNTLHPSSNVNNYAWVPGSGVLVQGTGISLAPGTALFNDTSPTEVRATIYRSDGTLYDTVYTQVGVTETQQILLNTRAPVQPYGYQASATSDSVGSASQSVTMTVDSTQQYTTLTTSSNVQSFGYTYNSSTRQIVGNGSGYSLVAGSALYNDTTPTEIRARVYRSDGTLVHTIFLRPGHSVVQPFYPGYGQPSINYEYWYWATNWNGQVNLGSLPTGSYYAEITTSDSAVAYDTISSPGRDYDGTWTRTNTVNFTIGGSVPDHIDTRLSWPESVTPSGTSSISFRYKPTGSSTWTTMTVSSGSSIRYVDFDRIANGSYNYEIIYRDAYSNVLKSTTAIFTVNGATDSTHSASFSYNTYSASATTGSSIPAFPMTASEAQTVARLEARVYQAGTGTQVGSTATTYPAAHANYFAVNGQYYVNLRTGSVLPNGRYDVQITKYYKNGTSATVTHTLEVGLQSEATNQNKFWNAYDNWSGQVNLKSGTGVMPIDTYRIEIAVRDDAPNYGNHNGTVLGSTTAPGADGDGTWTRANTVFASIGTHYTALQWSNALQPAGTVVEFGYRPAGSSAAFTLITPSLNNGQYSVNFDRMAAGNYEYRIRYLNRDDAALNVLPTLTLDQLRPSTSGNDRQLNNLYDNAGRLLQTTKSSEAAIINSYDGASRVIRTEQGGAVTRYFYNKDGRLAGTLDAERYFSEHVYDSADRLIQTLRYDVQVSTSLQASGTLAQIKTAVQSGPTLKSCYYYDAQGRQVGRVDERGFLQETVYDTQHVYREERQYLTPVTVAANDTLATLKSRAGSFETVRYTFDTLGRLVSKTAADGTVTNYQYDVASRLVQTIEAADTVDARITVTRYNAFGDVTGTATAAGAGINNYAWTASGGQLVQTTGISLAPGAALFGDTTPTEVKATIYRSDGTLYDTVYTTVGSTSTQQIILNTRTPTQPYGYQATATTDTVAPATQSVNMTVDSTQQYNTLTTTSNVQSFGYTYNSSTRQIVGNGTGYSLVAGSALYNDTTPTEVMARVYRTDGTLVHTVFMRPGHSEVVPFEPGYGQPTINYEYWRWATNWNGQVNLGSLQPGQYYVDITTSDHAAATDTISSPGKDGDPTWTRTNTVNFTIGGSAADHIDTRLSWPESVTPSGTSSISFRYKPAGSSAWTTMTVNSGSSIRYVDFDRIANGNYDYEIIYRDAYSNVLKSTTAVFTVNGTTDSTPAASFSYNAYSAGATTGSSIPAFPMTASEAQSVARLEARVFQPGTSTQVGSTATTYPAAHSNYFAVNGQYYVNLRTGSVLPNGRYDVQITKYYKDGTSAVVTHTIEVGLQPEPSTQNYFWNPVNNWNGQVNLKLGSGSMPAGTYRIEISVRDDAPNYGNHNGTQLGSTGAPGADGDPTWQRVSTVYASFGASSASAFNWDAAIDQYGVRYQIDGAGRRIAELHPNGQKTLLYYDRNGQLIYSVNALGEVSAIKYNAFGEVESTRVYSGRIDISGLTGGADTSVLTARIAAIANSTTDKLMQYAYTRAGHLASTVDGENFTTSYAYNNRGERTDETRTISSGVTVNTRYELDLLGRATAVIQDNGGLSVRTQTAYDGFGRIRQTRDARGKNTDYSYTDSGRTITITDPTGVANRTVYDAYGRIADVYDGLNQRTRYAYDTASRRVTVTMPDNVSISIWKTRTGEILKVQDGNGGVTEYAYTMDGKLATVKDARGVLITQNTYDNSGRLHEARDANGTVTRYSYDAANRVVERAVDPIGLNLRTGYQFDGQGRQILVTEGVGTTEAVGTQYIYDREGRIKQIVVDPAGLQLSTRFGYDGLGNVLTVEQGTVASPAQALTQYTYDKLGRKTREQQDPAGLNITTEYRYDENGRTTRLIQSGGRNTWFGYDDAGRLLREIDALGGVTRHYYDNNGRLAETVRFFNAVGTGSLGDTASSGPGATDPTPHANDARTYYVYDSNDRVRYTLKKVDSTRWQASERLYDGNGNVIETRSFDQYLDNSSVISMLAGDGFITETEFTGLTYAGNIANAGRAIQVYDANNRARYTLSAVDAANWAVTENLYDNRGNVIEARRYDKYLGNTAVTTMIATGSSGGVRITEAEMAAAMTALGYTASSLGSNTQRSFFAYDARDRLRFTVNALGQVSENVYDALGNVKAQTQFASVPTLDGIYTEANINGKVNRTNTSNQTMQFVYDKAGRLKQSIDALNKNEYFDYDAMGNKTVYTNKNGAVWNYVYDKAGRLKQEISPAVNVIYGSNTAVQSRRLRTEITYDAMGNVATRTEGVVLLNADGSSVDTSAARTIAYEHDALGRQIKTTLPGWYDPATGRMEKNSAAGRFQITSEILYDALGNAMRNRTRVANNGTAADYTNQYKTYDGLGRLLHDVDVLGNVTTNTYDGLNLRSIRRSTGALPASIPNGQYWTAADVGQYLATNSNDRIINLTYDRLGRKTEASQLSVGGNYNASSSASANPASISAYTDTATTRYYYNSLGQMTAEEAKVNQTEWARTFHFYDKLNRETAVVDALGYVTTNAYDAFGNLTRTIEYAVAVNMNGASLTNPVLPARTAATNDRRTDYTYDKLNRLRTVQNSIVSISGSGFSSVLTEVLRNTYDNAGNITTQVANGLTTTRQYDALGRVTRVTDPQRGMVAAGAIDPFKSTLNVSPVTDFSLDVFGNAVKIELSSAGAMNGATVTVQQSFDYAGNLLEHASGGAATRFEYDMAGRVTREYRYATAAPSVRLTESRYYYDAAGRQLATTAVVTDAGVKHQSGRSVAYNAFGDVTHEYRVWGLASVNTLSGLSSSVQRSLTLDTMGRATSSQGQDGTTFYYYDLLGNATREEKRGNQSTADGTDTRITETVYDLLGRARLQRLPVHSGIADSLGTAVTLLNPKVTQDFDRWGNVTVHTDAAGGITRYDYNQNNQVLRETLPTATAYREDGTSYAPTQTHEIHYNTLGLAVLEVDRANGTELRSRSNTYDAVGQQTAATDATGVRTEYVYDAMGNRVGTRNGLGTVYVDTFDVLGRQVERAVLRRSNGSAYNSYGTDTPVKVVLNTFEYDAVGRRTADWSYWVTDPTTGTTVLTSRNAKSYQYNELGNLTQSTNEANIATTYKYDIHGNKIEERNALGHTLRWNYSAANYAFGRLDTTHDISNVQTSYTYNDFGQLTRESRSGSWRRDYEYHQNGLTKSVTQFIDQTTAHGPGSTSVRTDYDYDIRSNRAKEIHSASYVVTTPVYDAYSGQVIGANTTSGSSSFTQLMAYDTRNRLSQVRTVPGGTVLQGGFARSMAQVDDLSYYYDEFGNRMRIAASYKEPGDATVTTRNSVYAYDKEGRVLLEDGTRLTYDAAGQRKTEESFGTGSFVIPLAAPDGGIVQYNSRFLTTYSYNDLGLVQSMLKEETRNGTFTTYHDNDSDIYTYYAASTTSYVYDLRGFKLEERKPAEIITTGYHADGRASYQRVTNNSGVMQSYTSYTNYDAAGNLREYQYTAYRYTGEYNYRNTYTYNYIINNGEYKNSGIAVTSDLANYTTGRTDISFDAFGNIAQTSVNNGRNSQTNQVQYTHTNLVYDNDRRIIFSYEDRPSPSFDIQNSHLYVNGDPIAKISDNGMSSFSPFHVDSKGLQSASTPSQYIVRGGETLQDISQTVYGNSRYWYMIADANGLSYGSTDTIPPEDAGRPLRIPSVVPKYNDADTFKPYNPAEIIGDLTPSPVAPPPPKENKSGGIIAIIAVIVTIVVAIYAPYMLGTLAEAWGGMAGVMFGAAMGNVAGQAVRMAGGIQDGFDFTSLATDVITAGLTSKIGGTGAIKGANGAINYGNVIKNAVINNVVGQGVGIALGTQDKFDWRSLAASVIAAPITAKIDKKMGTGEFAADPSFKGSSGHFGTDLASSLLKGTASNAVQVMVNKGGKMEWASIAANAFGQALGGSIVKYMESRPEAKAKRAFAEIIGEFTTGSNGDPVDEKTIRSRYDQATADKLIKMFSDSHMVEFDKNGKMIIGQKLKDYLDKYQVSSANFAAEQSRIMAAIKSGDLRAFYDFGYVDHLDMLQARDTFDQSMTSLYDEDRALMLALEHNASLDKNFQGVLLSAQEKAIELLMQDGPVQNLDEKLAALKSQMYQEMFNDPNSGMPKKVRKAITRDLESFHEDRDKFVYAITKVSLSVKALEDAAVALNLTGDFKSTVSDMRKALTDGYFTLRPHVKLHRKDGFVARHMQLNTGSQSDIVLLHDGLKQTKDTLFKDIFHEMMHTTSVNAALQAIESGSRPRSSDYYSDPKAYYDKYYATRPPLTFNSAEIKNAPPSSPAKGVAIAKNYEDNLYEGNVNNWYPEQIIRLLDWK